MKYLKSYKIFENIRNNYQEIKDVLLELPEQKMREIWWKYKTPTYENMIGYIRYDLETFIDESFFEPLKNKINNEIKTAYNNITENTKSEKETLNIDEVDQYLTMTDFKYSMYEVLIDMNEDDILDTYIEIKELDISRKELKDEIKESMTEFIDFINSLELYEMRDIISKNNLYDDFLDIIVDEYNLYDFSSYIVKEVEDKNEEEIIEYFGKYLLKDKIIDYLKNKINIKKQEYQHTNNILWNLYQISKNNYELQKMIIEHDPLNAKILENPLPEIKEKYADLFNADKYGFFGLK